MNFTFVSSDIMDSVLQTMNPKDGITQKKNYSVYGDTVQSQNGVQSPGFNGERRDLLTGATHLGNGYRAYNPVLMRFHCPDSSSPFGNGGLNCYAYCEGEPINCCDPSGHQRERRWISHSIGVLRTGLSTLREICKIGDLVSDWWYKKQYAGGEQRKTIENAMLGEKFGRGDNADIFLDVKSKNHIIKKHRSTNIFDNTEVSDFNLYYGAGSAELISNHELSVDYIRMRKVDGIPLNRIKKNELPKESINKFNEMIDGLVEKNIIHTDLSKGNILWDNSRKCFNPIDFSCDSSRIISGEDASSFYMRDRNVSWRRMEIIDYFSKK